MMLNNRPHHFNAAIQWRPFSNNYIGKSTFELPNRLFRILLQPLLSVMQMPRTGSTGSNSPGRLKSMLSHASEKIGFSARKDKDQDSHYKPSARNSTKHGQTRLPPAAQYSSSSDSSGSQYHDAQADAPMEDLGGSRSIPGYGEHGTDTRSGGGATSGGGIHRPGMSPERYLDRIRQLEGNLEKEKARTAERGKTIQGLMETVQSQKIDIEKISRDYDRLVAEKQDLQGTWGVQKRDLEMMVRRRDVTIGQRNAEIQDLEMEYKKEVNCRREWVIRNQALEKAQREAMEEAGRERMQNEELTRELAVQKKELGMIIRRLEATVDKRNTEIQDLKTDYKEESNRRRELGIRIQALEKAQREATEEADKERMQMKELKRELAATQRHTDNTMKLLKTRTEELTAAQAFLTTADECSGADLARMVAQLNDDISHCCVLMAEAVIEPDALGDTPDEGVIQEVVKDLSGFGWTEAQIRRLHPNVLKQDTTLFEAMVQNIFVCWCHRLVSSFCYDSRTMDRYFQELWDGIATSTDAIIAKNWLSMTHSQLKKNRFDESQVIRSLASMMFAVGWRATTPQKTDFAHRVEEKVGDICANALKVKEIATQKILSADVRLFNHAPGTPYNLATMEDVYGSGKEPEKANLGQPVLCSTGLGVRYAVMHPPSSGRERSWNVILKSKVVLASEVEI
ncbi:hypothetical protein H1R20_g14833, partial [Candolleomyces eurysporus]